MSESFLPSSSSSSTLIADAEANELASEKRRNDCVRFSLRRKQNFLISVGIQERWSRARARQHKTENVGIGNGGLEEGNTLKCLC